MRGFYNVNFKIPGFSFPPFESYPVTEISDADVYRYFESRGGTRYRLNRARTSYGELKADSMFMNYGYPTFTGYTASGEVSGTDGLNQTRFSMTPTTITLKSKGYNHFTVTDHVRVLTNLVVDNSTLTKTLTTQFDTTTNSLSVTTFTRTNTLSVHDGSSTRFLNVSAYTNTNTLSVKDLTTTKTLSTLNGSFTWWLNVSAHTNTETLSVKDLTTTKTLSTLNGSYTWWLNVSAHTNTHTLSVKDLTTTKTLSVLEGGSTWWLNVSAHTNTHTLSTKTLTTTETLSVLSGTYTNFLNVLNHTNTRSLSVKDDTTTDFLNVLHHTNSDTLSSNVVDIANQVTIGSNTYGNPINYLYKDSSGFIEVDGKVYYSADVVDHMVQWLSGMGDRIYNWWQTGNYSNRNIMSYPVSENAAYQAQSQGNLFEGYEESFVSDPSSSCTRWSTGLIGVTDLTVIGSGISIGTVTGISQSDNVWGNNAQGYADDSSFNCAAVHAGLVSPGQTRQIKFVSVGIQPEFIGTLENGIRSRDWGGSWCAIRLQLP